MFKTMGLCILIFTIYSGVARLLKRLRDSADVLDELIALFRNTLKGVKAYMKPIGAQITDCASPVLKKRGIIESILTKNIENIRDCDELSSRVKELLCEYIQSYGGVDYESEVLLLEKLVSELYAENNDFKDDLSRKRRLYTTLGASISFALIIFVI